jgi:hypothetical protein
MTIREIVIGAYKSAIILIGYTKKEVFFIFLSVVFLLFKFIAVAWSMPYKYIYIISYPAYTNHRCIINSES